MKKRIAILCGFLLLATSLSSCQKEPEKNDSTSVTTTVTTTVTPEASYQPQSGEGVLSCKRNGSTVEVTVTLANHSGAEVSLIAISDPQYQLTWWENSDACLSDLGQIKLDEKGQGKLTLTLKSADDTVYVILTAPGCAYMTEVN